MFHVLSFLSFAFLFLVLIIAGYQCIRRPNRYRVLGLAIMLIITVVYLSGLIFFPRAPFMTPIISVALAPAGILFVIYSLAFSEKRNTVLMILAVLFLLCFIVAYLGAIVNR